MSDSRTFKITEKKPAYSQWHVSLDISLFLDGDTISDVEFTAIDKNQPLVDATSSILDTNKCIWTDTIIKPYVWKGTVGITYKIQMKVVTAIGDKEIFWIYVTVT